MKKIFMFLGLAVAFASQAADYILDFRAATPVSSEAPVLRRAEMPLAVGQIPSVAVGDRLTFKLFEGVSIDAKVSAALPSSFTEGRTFSLTLGDGVFSSTFVENSDGVLIELRDIGAGMLYVVVARGDEVYIEETDLSLLRRGNCIEVETPELDADGAGYDESSTNKKPLLGAVPGNPFDDNVVAPAPVMVDIMLVFDNGAQAWIEKSAKYSSITNFAIAQVAKMNMVLRNTDLHTNFWYRLVDVATVDYRWTTIDDTILPSIEAAMRTRSGVWANIRDRREACGADVVSLLIDTGSMYGVTGIGYTTHGTTYNEWVNSYRRWCYSCCAIRSVDAEYTLCHEVGHNMGLTHSPTLASWKKVATFDYSNGYNITNATDGVHYNTIMAYNYDRDYSDYREIPYFSSPLHKYAGVPVGTTISNDCTRALRQTCVGIADWHAQTLPLPSDVIFSPSGTSAYRISLSNLGGYEIHYTTDGSTPTRESALYTEPLKLLSSDMVVKAVAVVDSETLGTVATKTYVAAVELSDYAQLEASSSSWQWGDWCDQNGGVVYSTFWNSSSDKTAVLDVDGVINVDRNISLATLVAGGTSGLEIALSDCSLFATNFEIVGMTMLSGVNYSFNNWWLHPESKVILAPGAGRSVTLTRNLSLSYPTATFAVTNGTVVAANSTGSTTGQLGSAAIHIFSGGTLRIAGGGWNTGNSTDTSLTVDNGGTLEIAAVDDIHRNLILDGGTLSITKSGRAASFYNGLKMNVTDDSTITDNGGTGEIWIRVSDANIDVAKGKTLTFDAALTKPSDNGFQSSGNGLVKTGQGEIRFLKEINHLGTNTVSEGTITVGYNSTAANGLGWVIGSDATLKIEDGGSLIVPSLSLSHGASLKLPAMMSVPLQVNGTVDLTHVVLTLTGATDVSNGVTYPLISATGGFSGVSRIKISDFPALENGLTWHISVAGDTLSAKVVTLEEATPAVPLVSNDESIVLDMPTDVTRLTEGGVELTSSPLTIGDINTKAIAITLDVEIPTEEQSERKAICSWKVGSYVIYCVREPDGKLDCYWINEAAHSVSDTGKVTLTSGLHTICIGYYSSKWDGTWVYVDGKPAYHASGLKWENSVVSDIAIGGIVDNASSNFYKGLVVKKVALVDAASNAPLAMMTDSGSETVKYNYVAARAARAFATFPAGGFSLEESVLAAEFDKTYDSASISVIASFPTNSVGSICGLWFYFPNGGTAACQAEYEGDGTFAIRYDGNSLGSLPASVLETPEVDVSLPHLYTLTYTSGIGVSLYLDNVEILVAEAPYNYSTYSGNYLKSPITFGCGPWHVWRGSSVYNPNPMPGFKVYSSHIALGTDDILASVNPVIESLNFDSAYDGLSVAKKLSYLPTCQTATGVDVPAGGFNEPEEPEKPEVLPIVRLPVVDILVAFDNGAQAYVAEKSMSLEAFAEAQIAKMNDALATNRLDACYSYRLAGVCKVDATYRQINAISTELAEGVGALVVLRAQRELYGADTVTLLIDNVNDATLGYGCPMTTTDASSCHDDAFSVCSIKAVHTGKQHTMLHENAHNMGCGHADNVQQCSPFEYGRGYYFSDPEEFGSSRHTIMAYGGDSDASWYFSTSEIYTDPYLYSETEEDYVTLGDVNHDNKRVLTETCGAVSQWRDYVKPFADDVIATDDADNEIFSGRVFKESIMVSLSVRESGATIYYTTDGTLPTSVSSVYSAPLSITEDTTLMVASRNGDVLSPIRTIKLFRIDSIPNEGIWRTSVKYPWGQDGDGSIRSFNHTEYGYKCTTPLAVKVEGPRRLSFMQKSYFSTPDIDSNYSHIEIMLDDQIAYSTNYYDKVWRAGYVDIPEGEHEVQFVFSQRDAMNKPDGSFRKDNNIPEMDDAWWIKNIEFGDVPRVAFVNCTSGSNDVEWGLPYVYEANELEGNLGGIEIGTKFGAKGIVETLGFGSTNAVVLSVLAELPEGKVGEIAGCKIYRSDDEIFHAFAYSNGDGTFSLGYADEDGNNTLNTATSKVLNNWKGLHIWTFAFGAQKGAKLYCDSELIAETTKIQWANTTIKDFVSFGDDPRGGMAIEGIKIYAVDSDFGVGESIFNQVDGSVNRALTESSLFSSVAEESLDNKLALLSLYNETGSIPDKSVTANNCVLRISEIMPKPTDDRTLNGREGMDVNGLESGWVEVENTSDQWADLKDYRFIRVNRGKETKTSGKKVINFPEYLVPPRGRAIFYTSERYPNSDTQEESAFEHGTFDGKPVQYGEDLKYVLVWGKKINPKKSPFVRLYYAPDNKIESVVDTVVIPSDLPEGWSIIVGDAAENEGTRRWMCPTPTRGKANTKTDGLTRIGPNVGPLYEKEDLLESKIANEFVRPVPPAIPGQNYEVALELHPVMNPNGAFEPRAADKINSFKLVYRKNLDNTTLATNESNNAVIPASYLPAAGHLMQWKVLITDGEGTVWTSPSFNNKDDGYEWYGTIVEAPELESATLPTWHMFVDNASKAQMDYDKDDSRYTLPNGARVAIYDSSTSNYYDYVRIDLRGHTSAKFTKKSHGLRFAKAHPLTMRDIVSGDDIKDIRKTSLISEFADPSYMRQMIAFWLWKKMGNLVPFDFPVRCNMNGEFYQLAFNSERFTDELIEDVYGLDKFGYSYKNVGTLKSGSGTTAGGIEKKTPDDENESDITVLQNELRSKITAAQQVSSSPDGGDTGLDNADLTKFVVQKFDLPAWLNYLASAHLTQEMDDVWANVCAYYDNPEMKEGVRGTDTWIPLGYDFNLSFGQWYYADVYSYNENPDGPRPGLVSTNDWYKSHPFYGGNRVRCYKSSEMTATINEGNDGFEAVWQSAKFRRLYLRRLRTLMDQELKAPGTAEGATPFMFQMRKFASLMRADAALDQEKWPNNESDNTIDVWGASYRPVDMDAGIDDIWKNYVVPRREHLYVTHSITNTAWEVGYGSKLNAGIPEAQSPIAELLPKIELSRRSDCVVISNLNNEVVDMSGWTLKTGVDWPLPAGTVCDSNDCIYVVADRRAYINTHGKDLTDEVIIGNASIGDSVPKIVPNEADDSSGVLSADDPVVDFHADDDQSAEEWVKTVEPSLTKDDKDAGLDVQYLTIVAEKVEDGKYKAVVAVNPDKVNAPVIAEPAAEIEPVEVEEDDNGKTTVSVSISNAVKGLWYGYEVSDELGESANFINDVGSFERATEATHTVTGSLRDKSKTSGFFRIKVLPAQPSE